MMARSVITSLCVVMLSTAPLQSVRSQTTPTNDSRASVRRAESAFARTMADRDHEAFSRFLAPDAIFIGSTATLRGGSEIARGWKKFYEGADAPFSWRPEQVEVLESGDLALSSGPVFDADGKQIGTFNSIWRRQADGTWRVVFDKGCCVCDDD